jgi:hypothetical protein
MPAAIRLAFDDNREDNTDKSRSYAPLTPKTTVNTVMAVL